MKISRAQWTEFTRRVVETGWNENTLLMIFAVAIGAASAVGVVVFYKLIDLAFTLFYRFPGEHLPRLGFLGYRPILTALGFMAAWTVMRRLTGGNEGMNVPDVQLSVARRGGFLPARPALARTAASAITMGSGGSAGSEGPVAVLGSAIGSLTGRLFNFDSGQIKVLVASGAASGIAAAFNAPLGGAFFALEEIVGTFSAVAFAPIVVASVVGALVSRAFFGNHPAFPIPREYGFALDTEIMVLYPLLGVLCGLVAVLFIRTFFKARDLDITWKREHPLLLAAAGGLMVGLLVFLSNGVLVGYGHLAVRLEVFGRMAWYALALLAAGKIVATSITLNAGGSGGVFTPSLYIGAATGGAFGVAVKDLLPDLNISPEAYALVGMAGMVAATTGAPLTGILIVFEMTNDYAIVPALMLVVAIAMVIARKIEPDTLYSGELRRRGETLHVAGNQDALSQMRVAQVMQTRAPVHFDMSLAELVEHCALHGYSEIPVLGQRNQFAGMITTAELLRISRDGSIDAAAIRAADVALEVEAVLPQDSVLSVIQKLRADSVGALPVLDPITGSLIGIVTRSDVLDAVGHQLAHPD